MNLGFEFHTTAAKPKRESGDAPSQEPMRAGIKPAQQKAPSSDQKKHRRQMSKRADLEGRDIACPSCGRSEFDAADPEFGGQEGDLRCTYCGTEFEPHANIVSREASTTIKETPMSRQREAEILQAMAKADLPEQRRLMQDLEALRSEASSRVQADRDLDLAATVIRDTLTPVRVHERHTASTDWITELPSATAAEYDHAMRTEATLWFGTVHEAVKADREEFGEQAMGMARRQAGKFGEAAAEAAQVFLDTAARLHRMAGTDPSDQNGNAESTVTDYATEADQDPLFAEDWAGGDEGKGVHPPMPGAGEGTSTASRRTAYSAPDGVKETCGTCGNEIASMDYAWYHLAKDFPNGEDHNAHPNPHKGAARKVAVSLTNVGIEGDHGVGTDPSGNRVQFRLSDKDLADLKAVLYGDLNVNFSGVTVDEGDIIKSSARTAAEGNTCSVCGDKIAKDPAGEDPSTWHHDNGEKHDHEAKPSGDSKESARRTAGKWMVKLRGNSNFGRLVSANSEAEALEKADVNGDEDAYAVEQKESARKTADEGPTWSKPCNRCGATVERYRGEGDVSCPSCGAQYNAGGQQLRDDWADNPSNYSDDIGDLEGYEMQHAHDAARRTAGEVPDSFKKNWDKGDGDGDGDESEGKPWLNDDGTKKDSSRRTAARAISEVASDIYAEWGHNNINYAAKPYLEAMRSLTSVGDKFGNDEAKHIIAYFLSNAASFRGGRAKELKDELRAIQKGASRRTAADGGAWKAQVAGVGEGTWSGNGMTFDTPEEAKAWIADLSMRWFGFDMGRVVSSDTPTGGPVDMGDPTITHNFRTGSKTATDDQNGNADSSLEDVEVGDEGDKPMWPWELAEGDPATGQGAANVANVPTPGGESGYPQPKSSSLDLPIPSQGRLADFRARVQAGIVHVEDAGSRRPFAREAGSGWVELARRVVERSQHEGGLDLFSASVMLQVYDALGPENQAKFAAMPMTQAHEMAFKILDKTSAARTAGLDGFWEVIDAQLEAAKSAKSAADVLRIFKTEENPYGDSGITGSPAFFAGSGGDATLWDSLSQAGWRRTWAEASYYWVAQAPDGSKITYIEGDIYEGDTVNKTGSKTAMPDPAALGVAVGDIFYSSWGYDQTNIDFYEVTGLTGASIRLRPVRSRQVDSNGFQDRVVPVPGQYTGGEFLKRIQSYSDRPSVSLNSYSNAYLWDGTPKSQTNSMAGH